MCQRGWYGWSEATISERKWLKECSVSSLLYVKVTIVECLFSSNRPKHQSTCLSSICLSFFPLLALDDPACLEGLHLSTVYPLRLHNPPPVPLLCWRLTDVLWTVGPNMGEFLEVTVGCFRSAEMWDNCPNLLPSGWLVSFFFPFLLSSLIPAFIHFLAFPIVCSFPSFFVLLQSVCM